MYRFVSHMVSKDRVAGVMIAIIDLLSQMVFVYRAVINNGFELINDAVAFIYTMLCGVIIVLDVKLLIEKGIKKRVLGMAIENHLMLAIAMAGLAVCEVITVVTSFMDPFGARYSVNIAYEAVMICVHYHSFSTLKDLKDMVLHDSEVGA